MSEMATDDMFDGMGFSISIRELAENIKSQQQRQTRAIASDEVVDTKQSPEAFKQKVEEWLRKGYLNPPEPQPAVYQTEDKWAFLKRLPKMAATANPYSINEAVERGKNRGLIDPYSESKRKGETKPLDEIYQKEGVLPATVGKLDLYRERVKSRRPPTSPEQAAMAMIKKYGLR